MKLSFTKMQGCANDYIYLDCRASGVPADIAALAQRLSARIFPWVRRHHLHLRPCDPRGRWPDAHLQRGRQRSPDVRQRRALCGRVALHPRGGKSLS